jgi:hypothetical protein
VRGLRARNNRATLELISHSHALAELDMSTPTTPAACTETSECTLADVLSAIEDIEDLIHRKHDYVRPPPPPPFSGFGVGGCDAHRLNRVGVRVGLTPRHRDDARVTCTGKRRQ